MESGYGVHLVHLSARTALREPALDDVRDNGRREWANAQRQQANEAFFQKLLSRYTALPTATYAIGALATFWFIDRVAAFWV